MSRTLDLVVARLRLVALRRRAAAASDRDRSAGGADGAHDHRNADLPADDWPPVHLWVRVVGLLVLLVTIGAAILLFTSWPRERATVLVPARSGPTSGSGDPAASPVPEADPFAGVPATPMASTSPSPATPWLLVHVTGEVRHPGIVRLPPGSRVDDALAAAGGLRRGGEVGATNLARLVVDGERIEIGADAPPPAGAAGPGAPVADPTGPAAPVDLNTATSDQLQTLPGIGPVTAAKILAWRADHGRFTVVDELAEVSGIGPRTLAELRPLVRV